MKKSALFLGMSLMILCSSCQTTDFAFSGGIGISTSKTENGNTKSTELGLSSSPDAQEIQGKHASQKVSEDGTKAKTKELGGSVKREKKPTGPSGN